MSDTTTPRKTRRQQARERRQVMMGGKLEPKLERTVRTKPSWDGSMAKTGVVIFEDADGAEPLSLSAWWEDGLLVIRARTPFPVDFEADR